MKVRTSSLNCARRWTIIRFDFRYHDADLGEHGGKELVSTMRHALGSRAGF